MDLSKKETQSIDQVLDTLKLTGCVIIGMTRDGSTSVTRRNVEPFQALGLFTIAQDAVLQTMKQEKKPELTGEETIQ